MLKSTKPFEISSCILKTALQFHILYCTAIFVWIWEYSWGEIGAPRKWGLTMSWKTVTNTEVCESTLWTVNCWIHLCYYHLPKGSVKTNLQEGTKVDWIFPKTVNTLLFGLSQTSFLLFRSPILSTYSMCQALHLKPVNGWE